MLLPSLTAKKGEEKLMAEISKRFDGGWEKMLAKLDSVNASIECIHTAVRGVNERLDDLETSFDGVQDFIATTV